MTWGSTSAAVVVVRERTRAGLIASVIALGLALDQRVEYWGQVATNIAVWALFAHCFCRAMPTERIALAACLLFATLGEIFLALVWGLYDYRLGTIPLFVPPGHVLLFLLGRELAQRLSARMAAMIPIVAAPFVIWLGLNGADTFGVPLFALFVVCLVFSDGRRLYAAMFVLALAMELYATWCGNWTWRAQVPWLGLSTINPPIAAGAFYCVLDLLVIYAVRACGARSRLVAMRPDASARAIGDYGRSSAAST